MLTDNQLKLLRALVQEEIGRNYHTIDNSPYHFSEFPGYDVQINPNQNEAYTVTIFFEEKPLDYDRTFSSREEAVMFARKKVERHRVSNSH